MRLFFLKFVYVDKSLLAGVESAAFPGQSDDEIDRLLHLVRINTSQTDYLHPLFCRWWSVVVQLGLRLGMLFLTLCARLLPSLLLLSGEMHDFLEVRVLYISAYMRSHFSFKDDLKSWYPELANRIRITLVEALPSVLPTFSKELINYTVSTFKASKIDILTKTMVQEIKENSVVLKMQDGKVKEMPCGLVIWAAGNTTKQITRDLIPKFPEEQTNKRGIVVDGKGLFFICLSKT
jgi:NADH:ubiquinone reductase (non-electrogenic)